MKKFLLLCLCLALAWQIKVCASAEEAPKSRYTINSIEFSMNDNNNFSGRAVFYPSKKKAIFEIINKSKMPFDFKDALFYAVTSPPNKTVYQLEYDKTYYKQNQQASSVINPEDTIAIQCILPNNSVSISGAYIKLIDSTEIDFEYGAGNKKEVFKEEEGWKAVTTSSGKTFHVREVDKEEKDWWEE